VQKFLRISNNANKPKAAFSLTLETKRQIGI